MASEIEKLGLPAKEACPECKGMKKVDWHYLDGSIKMEDCPKCSGTGTINKEVK
jgi:DnaJ-class molecular chaperone